MKAAQVKDGQFQDVKDKVICRLQVKRSNMSTPLKLRTGKSKGKTRKSQKVDSLSLMGYFRIGDTIIGNEKQMSS